MSAHALSAAERGELEYERLVAEARKEAAGIVAAAELHRDSLAEEGRREAQRLVDAASAEAEQLLHALFGSLADIFKRWASEFLDALTQRSFSSARSADTVREFVTVLASGDEAKKVERLQAWLDSAEPQSFLEALLILAMVFYSGSEGFTHFQIDKNLQGRLAMSDLAYLLARLPRLYADCQQRPVGIAEFLGLIGDQQHRDWCAAILEWNTSPSPCFLPPGSCTRLFPSS